MPTTVYRKGRGCKKQYPELCGKRVKSVEYEDDGEASQAITIGFDDGTEAIFDFTVKYKPALDVSLYRDGEAATTKQFRKTGTH